MHCLIVIPPPSSIWKFQNIWSLIDAFRRNPHCWSPITLFCTSTGKIHFYIFTVCLNKSLPKECLTLIQHHPPLAPIEVSKCKFPIMWYFNVLPLLTYWNTGYIFHSVHCDVLKHWLTPTSAQFYSLCILSITCRSQQKLYTVCGIVHFLISQKYFPFYT